MANLINQSDTLNQGRQKLNAAILDAEDAKIEAGKSNGIADQASTTAKQAVEHVNSIQEQFNQIIIEGDSSVEAAQARVDETGASHSTLKARLDTGFAGVNQQLTDIVVNIKSFGVTGLGIDGESTNIVDAVEYCRVNGYTLKFPKGRYVLNFSELVNGVIPACKMIGDGIGQTVIALKGNINFDTSKIDNMQAENLTIEVSDNYLTDVNSDNYYAVFNTNSLKSTFVYRNLEIKGIVPLTDGTQRVPGGIRDGCSLSGVIENIITENVASCISTLENSQNYYIKNVESYNFQTCIFSKGENYDISNIKGINTFGQSLVWIQKNHPTSPRKNNGLDLVLCSGDNYTLVNLDAEHPIERCVYSQGGNVTADTLRCLNADGFKFVGANSNTIKKNIKVSNTLLEVTEDLVSMGKTGGLSEITLYWVDGVTIENHKSVLTSPTNNAFNACVTFSGYTKNVKIRNVHSELANHSLLYCIMRSESGLSSSDYLVAENISLDNAKMYKNEFFSTGSLFSTRTSEASNDAKANYACRNVEIKNSKVVYTGEGNDEFWYDYSYTDGFYATGNKANKRTRRTSGYFESDRTLTKNIVLMERGIATSNISGLISSASVIKLTKGSSLIFKYDAEKVELSFAFWVNNNLANTDKQKVSPLSPGTSVNIKFISHGTYMTFPSPFLNRYSIILKTTDGDYYVGKVVDGVKTDIIGTSPLTISASSALTFRGDQYAKPYEVEINGIL